MLTEVEVYLAGAANQLMAHLAVVGEVILVALDAVHVFLPEDVPLAVQGILTLDAVVGIRHRG